MIAHIATIRTKGAVVGFQLRHPEGTRYFAVRKLGGVESASAQAMAAAASMGLTLRHQPRHATQGIRFQWVRGRLGEYLYVMTSFRDKDKRLHVTGYSTHKHGLTGALDLAIFARESAGHSISRNTRATMLTALQAEFESRGDA